MASKSLDSVVRVGMGEMKVARPPMILSAVGIGSCVAVIIRDNMSGTGGMAHVMLPWIPSKPREGANLFKYANYAIECMVDLILKNGGSTGNLGAKIVGGSHMFDTSRGTGPLDIGARNLHAVKKKLDQLKIKIIAEDIGGSHGRSVETSLDSGEVIVRSVRKGTRVL